MKNIVDRLRRVAAMKSELDRDKSLIAEAAERIATLEKDNEILSAHIREMALSLGKQFERMKMLEEDIVELRQYAPSPDPSELA